MDNTENLSIFDSHAHYDDEKFEDAESLVSELHEKSGVRLILDAGADLESTEKAKKLAEKFDFIYFAAGIHPENVHKTLENENWLDIIENYAAHPKCKAIGEIGYDYYYGKETAALQRIVFEKQMELAGKLSLPVIIHDRDAHADSLETVLKYPSVKGVFHSYSGSFEMAKVLLKNGWYISVNGIITFKNARRSVEVLEQLRDYGNGKYLERLLVETDCPYLAPVPKRGTVNHSGNILYTAEKAAEILGMSVGGFLDMTYRNAVEFYHISEA